jgi:hypothetical protein
MAHRVNQIVFDANKVFLRAIYHSAIDPSALFGVVGFETSVLS